MSALARQLLVIQGQLQALNDAVLVAMELVEGDLHAEIQQPTPAPAVQQQARPCRHRQRESLAGFGGHNARKWRCKDCGFEGED